MQRAILQMSGTEREQLRVMGKVKEGLMKLIESVGLMGVSYRQCKRIYRRYREEGDGGLVHRSRGRPSLRRKGDEFRESVLRRYRERYEGFGPTLASE